MLAIYLNQVNNSFTGSRALGILFGRFGATMKSENEKKKLLATQNSNMATIFQDGRHLQKVAKM